VGQNPQKGDIFTGVVGSTQVGVTKASANAHNGDRQVMVTHIYTDLLEAAGGGEGCDGVGYWPQAAHGHTRSQTHHVCLCYPTIHKSFRETVFVTVKQMVPDVPG